MDLLRDSFKVDSHVDLTQKEVIELCHGAGIAYQHQNDDYFNTTIETTTTVDDESGKVHTFLVMPSLPDFLQKADRKKVEHEIVKVLGKEPNSPLPASSSNVENDTAETLSLETQSGHARPINQYDIGLIGRALNVEDATRLFQRALLINLNDDKIYYEVQGARKSLFREKYQLMLNKKAITSLANSNEYINKYIKNECFNIYNAIVTINYKRLMGENFNFQDAGSIWSDMRNSVSVKNPRYMQLLSPLTKHPRTVNDDAMIATIAHLVKELDISSDLTEYFYHDDTNMAMLDFIKKAQPMFYDLNELFGN